MKPPFLAKNMKELYSKVTKGGYPDIPRHFSRDLAKVIGRCLNTSPSLRPMAAELLQEAPFNGTDITAASDAKSRQHRRSNSQAAAST